MPSPADGLSPTAESPARVCCDRCGEVLGVYEPLILAAGGRVRETSRAAEQSLPLVGATYYHRACYYLTL